MKIISKYKDYYDFCVGKYGMDEKVVYDRTKFYNREYWRSTPYTYLIAFCGTLYRVIVVPKEGREAEFIYGDEYYVTHNHNKIIKYADYDKKFNRNNLHLKPTTINDEINCPVVIFESCRLDEKSYYHCNPVLKEFDFNKVLSPEDCWVQISNWLSREKDIKDNRTNNEKIVTNGFDLKTSFRKM